MHLLSIALRKITWNNYKILKLVSAFSITVYYKQKYINTHKKCL